MHTPPFTYRPIIDRPGFTWPGGAKVAFYLGLNIEHFHLDKPSTSINAGTAELVPDALNYGWRDYGARVGVWRILDSLDRHALRASALVNSEVLQRYPEIVRAGVDRNWAWLAHGETNSRLHTGLTVDEERQKLADIHEAITWATGRAPRGWMGPGLTETAQTPHLLAELGMSYTLDWTNDDQPYWFDGIPVMGLPYTVELNDLGIFTAQGMSGGQFEQMANDHLDQLLSEPRSSVMPLAIHPFVTGQASRTRYLEAFLKRVAAEPDVWVTTSDDIATAFAAVQPFQPDHRAHHLPSDDGVH